MASPISCIWQRKTAPIGMDTALLDGLLFWYHGKKFQISVAVVDKAVGVAFGAVMAGAGARQKDQFCQ